MPLELTLQNNPEEGVFSRRGSEETDVLDPDADEKFLSTFKEAVCQEKSKSKSEFHHLQHLLVGRGVFEDLSIAMECTPL